ncbi:MAG: glycosyltransferase family 2 protein, partial [Gemmatimonadota bacterium]
MDLVTAAGCAAGAALVVLTAPGTAELLALSLAAPAPARRPVPDAGLPRLAVVVPAHDEEAGIAACVESLHQCAGASECPVVVVADNCTDDTAGRAAAAGARVLVRRDPTRRGKAHALDHAFQALMGEGYEAFAVVDADTTAEPNLLAELRTHLAAGADAVQARYGVRNPEGSVRTRLLRVALMAFNVLRPRGRARLGFSAGILGNGFALSRGTLEAVPYRTASVTEDLQYHIDLVLAGRRVDFADRTSVWGDMPATGSGVSIQRSRWEGGRLRAALDNAPRLAGAVLRGRWRAGEALLDLLLPPLAFHTILLALAAAVPVP